MARSTSSNATTRLFFFGIPEHASSQLNRQGRSKPCFEHCFCRITGIQEVFVARHNRPSPNHSTDQCNSSRNASKHSGQTHSSRFTSRKPSCSPSGGLPNSATFCQQPAQCS